MNNMTNRRWTGHMVVFTAGIKNMEKEGRGGQKEGEEAEIYSIAR